MLKALIRSAGVTSGASNRFSAAGSAIGYLAQVEYALLIALQRMDTAVEARLSIEAADDITFEEEGQPRELWQTKHHIDRHGSLGNSSPDIWKTIHNWAETSSDGDACFLFTTVSAPNGSAASLLAPGRSASDIESARDLLDVAARAGGNQALAAYYATYLGLADDQRLALVGRMTILDGAVNAASLTEHLIASVRKSTVAQHRTALIQRLRGWWHARVLDHLTQVAAQETDWIALSEIEDRLLSIAQTLRDDALPLDYGSEVEPTQDDVDASDRVFVEQLKIIVLHHERIRQAVYDHNRAFLQRSRWQREQLLAIDELDTYDRRLIEEWRRVFVPLEEPAVDERSDDDKRRQARESYGRLQERALPEIRSEIRSGYIPLGSLHILADRLAIGWHPDWIALVKHRLGDANEPGAA